MALEANERVREVESSDFYISGIRGALIEYILEFEGGALLNTRWTIAVPGSKHLFMMSCSAESTNFEENMRPVFDQFFRSVTLD